jgi:hypothetical protein
MYEIFITHLNLLLVFFKSRNEIKFLRVDEKLLGEDEIYDTLLDKLSIEYGSKLLEEYKQRIIKINGIMIDLKEKALSKYEMELNIYLIHLLKDTRKE